MKEKQLSAEAVEVTPEEWAGSENEVAEVEITEEFDPQSIEPVEDDDIVMMFRQVPLKKFTKFLYGKFGTKQEKLYKKYVYYSQLAKRAGFMWKFAPRYITHKQLTGLLSQMLQQTDKEALRMQHILVGDQVQEVVNEHRTKVKRQVAQAKHEGKKAPKIMSFNIIEAMRKIGVRL